MKKNVLVLLMVLLAISFIASCGKKTETPSDNSAAGAPEEVADSTRLDSAAMPAATDTAATDTAAMPTDTTQQQGGGE